jgi:hypothetical protein
MAGLVTALVIAGSDKSGTIYGIYDISEQIGGFPCYEPTPHKSVDYRAFRLQTTTKGIIEMFTQ